jgi:hypothetical protein
MENNPESNFDKPEQNNINKVTSDTLDTENSAQPNSKPKSKILIVAIVIILIVLIAGGVYWFASSKNKSKNPNITSTTQNSSANQTQGENTQTFVTYSYTDPESGIEAFKLLIPEGWKAEGSVTWSPKVFLPATVNFRFYNPNGKDEFDIIASQDYIWTDNQLTLSNYPVGSTYFGTTVKEPVNLHTALMDIIIPKYRTNISDLKIVKEESVADLANLAKGPATDGVDAKAEGGKIRITYTENGQPMEEEIYGALSQFVVNYPGNSFSAAYYINNWYIDYLFSFRAPEGQLDSDAKIFETMLYSMQVNPKWYAKIANVKEELAKMNMDQIKAVGKMGQMIAQAASEMRDDQMRSWEYRQQSQDKISENFSDYIRGVDSYTDSYGQTVKLPSGYDNAWTNSSGEYIVSDSPSYNPNVGSNLNWQQLELSK